MNYQTFAKLYDDLFDEEAYADWQSYAQTHIQSKDGKLLELAGGAGRLAILLKQNGFKDVSVFDLSPEMLTLAAEHAEAAQIDLPLIQGDMREWSDLKQKYATITSFADSLNYLANTQEVLVTFKQVASHLEPNGQFLFDVISPWQTDVYYPGYMYNWHDEETAFMWSSYGVEDSQHIVEHELTFFVYNEDIDGYQQIQEIHTERTYDIETYQRLLKKAGFKDIQISADFGRSAVTPESDRWFFSAIKA
jgi:ubiquinone/menaquinone biosynthesis C-methylase UbiE